VTDRAPDFTRRALAAIVGPTAVGKTRISLDLATQFGAEIVSMDSRLLYRGMDIGTAKPGLKERQEVPHFLIDVAEPDQTWSLATYREAAERTIRQVQGRGNLPLLVGGTGQYYRALIEGWRPPKATRSEVFRARMGKYVDEHGPLALHQELERIDPESAARIDSRNIRRVVRALEIFHLSGRPASDQRIKSPPDYPVLVLGLTLPRELLYDRIDARIEAMLEDGWVEEVRGLMERGYSPELPSFSAIGYRELARYIDGEIDLEQARRQIQRASRQFVRRQANWFKPHDKLIHWFENRPGVLGEMRALVSGWQRDFELA